MDGRRKSEAAQSLQLSRHTLDLWLERQATTGDGDFVGRQDQHSEPRPRLAKQRVDAPTKTAGYGEHDEAKRAVCLGSLAALPLSQRVDVDEAGMDERDDDGFGWSPRGQRLEVLQAGRQNWTRTQ